jgi:NAD(P)-dependent dehydrogenase (short-subunit alcohol dehydrogenase family)
MRMYRKMNGIGFWRLQRIGTPQVIAGVALFLASELSSYKSLKARLTKVRDYI